MSPLKATQAGTKQTDSPFARLLAQQEAALALPQVGDVVKGTILEIAPNSLYVDLGASGVGIVFGRELLDAADTFRTAKIADEIEATVIDAENDQGYIELSLRSASEERSWQDLEDKLQSNAIFPIQVLDANKGGLIVRVAGITGFLPVSQLSAEHYPRVEGGDKQKILERLKQYVGSTFTVRVITADRREAKLIVSEKAAMTPEMAATLEDLKEGTIVEGTVSGVVDFGVFVKFVLNGQDLEGLVHISELAWQRVDDPRDFAKPGDHVKAMVISVDGTRISLSLKRLREDPWLKVSERYKAGDKVTGTVLKITPYGAFVKLDNDIHGLAHVSELVEKEGVRPEDVVKVGEEQTFTIISIDPDEHRLGLSLKTDAKPKAKKSVGSRQKAERATDATTAPAEKKDDETSEDVAEEKKETAKTKKAEKSAKAEMTKKPEKKSAKKV